MYSDAMLKVLEAREKIARQSPYFSGAIFTGKLLESTAMPTMWTNGINVYFNAAFVAQLREWGKKYDYDINVLVAFVLLHEYLHKLLNHVGRREWREIKKWNKACDYSVNAIILAMGYPEVPDMLYKREYEGMTPEKIYDALVEEEKNQPKKKGQTKQKGKSDEEPEKGDSTPEPQKPNADDSDDSEEDIGGEGDGEEGETDAEEGGGSGEGTDFPQNGEMQEPSQEELEEAETEAKRMAAKLSAKAGNMPQLLKQALTELFPTHKMDWRQVMEELAKDARDTAEKSWRRLNRRYASTDMILPGEDRGRIFRVVVCYDVSGSMTGDSRYLKEMKTETASLLSDNLVTNVKLLACDTEVTARADVTTPEEVESFQTHGGGGTCFDAIMREVGQEEDVVACIFLTDMETSSFGKAPDFPVIWVNWGRNKNATAPFGRVVNFEE